MSYSIGGIAIKRPNSMNWTIQSQFAENKTLDGSVTRDYMGNDKSVWELNYDNVLDADYQTFLSIYQDYLANGTRYFETTGETIVIGTNVHVTIETREFNVGGTGYLANFTVVLKEA